MIRQEIYDTSEVELSQSQPLSTLQLSLLADEVKSKIEVCRPEFSNIVKVHRNSGCRVHELFAPDRWKALSNTMFQIQPQKGNALRLLQFSDIGFVDVNDFQSAYNDMSRLSERQYERIFSQIVRDIGLWRLYEDGFARPGTHFFRHMKIKELYSQGYDKEYISVWIGEKKVDNLNFYLDSTFFV